MIDLLVTFVAVTDEELWIYTKRINFSHSDSLSDKSEFRNVTFWIDRLLNRYPKNFCLRSDF